MTIETNENANIDERIDRLKGEKKQLESDRNVLYSLLSEMKQSYYKANSVNNGFKK